MKNFENYNLNKKNVIVRVDLNVPVIDGKITEKSRITSILPTIKKLINQKNKVFLISHFGRPKGKKDDKYSLKFICPYLKKEFGIDKIFFLNNINEEQIKTTIGTMNPGDLCLIENIRFFPEEEINDWEFSKNLSKNFDVYVNDAFSASHRNHASIIGIPKFIPSFAGLSLINEIKNINTFISNPKKPNIAIIGGSKISTKINLFYNLSKFFETIVVGGAMANTFLYAKGINIGKSLCEKDLDKIALNILDNAKKFNCEIILPIDLVCADNLEDKINIRECDIKNILQNQMALDIGTKSIKLISQYILKSKMVLWNGPLGAFEYHPYEKSSIYLARLIKNNSLSLNISSLAGGGDTLSAIKMAKAEEGFTYISNAGGAFLEWLEGKKSPGIIALDNN